MNPRSHTKPVTTAVILIVLFLSVSTLGVSSLVRHEHNRDVKDWQRFMEAGLNAKEQIVTSWLDQQFSVLSALAANASLLHYTRESQRAESSAEVKQSQLTFLRNLIITTADKNGFQDPKSSTPIKANIPQKAENGLAILGTDLDYIIGTPGFMYHKAAIQQSITELQMLSQPILTGISTGNDGLPILGFIAPLISNNSSQGTKNKTIGIIYGYKSLAPLLNKLQEQSTHYNSEETLLIVKHQTTLSNISPLADGTPPLMMNRPLNGILASAAALNKPDTFGREIDYRGHNVFFIGTQIARTPWTLLLKIDTDQALSESQQHQRFLIIALGLATILIAALLAASWWYVSTIKTQALAKNLRRHNNILAAKNHLLDTINDNIHDLLLLVNRKGCAIFMSTLFARKLSLYPKDVEGRPLPTLLGKDQAAILEKHIEAAFATQQAVITPLTLSLSGSQQYLHAAFSPVHFDSAIGAHDAILITLHDLTALKNAEDREHLLQQQLLQTIMSAVDRHDPYSADHSAQTASLALLVGKALHLPAQELETLHTAASLCNLGKLSIHADILTKTDTLTEDELRQIRLESQYASSLLKDINFSGPVADTIAQKNEYLDGSGHPAGLKGAAILPTARILAAVNAFVAMISPRAYRDKRSPQEAMNQLMDKAEQRYDRRVLAALFQIVENEIDWGKWH